MKRVLVYLVLFSSFLFFGCNSQQKESEVISTDSLTAIVSSQMEVVSDTSK